MILGSEYRKRMTDHISTMEEQPVEIDGEDLPEPVQTWEAAVEKGKMLSFESKGQCYISLRASRRNAKTSPRDRPWGGCARSLRSPSNQKNTVGPVGSKEPTAGRALARGVGFQNLLSRFAPANFFFSLSDCFLCLRRHSF